MLVGIFRHALGYVYLVHLEECPLPHLLESTYFARVLFTSQEYLTITTLTDLCDDVELIDFELCAATAENNSLSSGIRLELGSIFCGV
jgi:hypothetical protein